MITKLENHLFFYKYFKVILAFVVIAYLSLQKGYSQDIIYALNGDVINCKILNVGEGYVSYNVLESSKEVKKFFLKPQLIKIKFEDGHEENYSNANGVISKAEEILTGMLDDAKVIQKLALSYDVIFTIDNQQLKGDVTEIDEETISYTRFESGSVGNVSIDKVSRIKYSNGYEESYTKVEEDKIAEKPAVNTINTTTEVLIASNTTEEESEKQPLSNDEGSKSSKKEKGTVKTVKGAKKVISTNYKRSSLCTFMVTSAGRNYEQDIHSYFSEKVLPDKYNNHNLETRFIPSGGKNNELENIKTYMETNKVANQLLAKWFNRSAKGGFSMKLIKERGFYDAKELDIKIAKSSARGMSTLADAGEELISNTFVLVNDPSYTNKEEVAAVAKTVISFLGSFAGTSIIDDLSYLAVDTMGKGFVVSAKSYLFKLVWDEETQNRFYNELWADDATITEEKRKAFDNASFFKLEYVGYDKSWADVQSTAYTSKSNSELIGRATVKSIDNVISKLQQTHDVFKTKIPLLNGTPICAKIGLKEGLTKKTMFEVLEQQEDEDGKISFVQVGMLKVDTKYPIWDNRFAADEENPSQVTDKTHFRAIKGKEFYPGLLLRQIK